MSKRRGRVAVEQQTSKTKFLHKDVSLISNEGDVETRCKGVKVNIERHFRDKLRVDVTY